MTRFNHLLLDSFERNSWDRSGNLNNHTLVERARLRRWTEAERQVLMERLS